MVAEATGLVADVGRTSVRFALSGGEQGFVPRDERRYAVSEHPTFTDALLDYVGRMGLASRPLPSVLSVAGLARGDVVNVTGSRWYLSLAGVEAVLRVPPRALNECAASALALTRLTTQDIAPLPGPPPALRVGGTFVVLGPGSGLGVAALVTHGDRLVPMQTEAGHLAFAARTKDEQAVVAAMARRGVNASNEAVVSAAGLANIHAALAGTATPRLSPEEVTRQAARDPIAARAVDVFVEALGSVIGDYVMAYGAWDGVFLTGALVRALGPRLHAPSLRRRLEDKDAFKRKLAQVPIAVVRRGGLELLGAAAALSDG